MLPNIATSQPLRSTLTHWTFQIFVAKVIFYIYINHNHFFSHFHIVVYSLLLSSNSIFQFDNTASQLIIVALITWDLNCTLTISFGLAVFFFNS